MSFCSWRDGEYYRDHFERGVYVCVKCGNELFNSRSKYEHSSPWPAFTETMSSNSLHKVPESPTAVKVHCGKCRHPLGHEFLGDGPQAGQSRF